MIEKYESQYEYIIAVVFLFFYSFLGVEAEFVINVCLSHKIVLSSENNG